MGFFKSKKEKKAGATDVNNISNNNNDKRKFSFKSKSRKSSTGTNNNSTTPRTEASDTPKSSTTTITPQSTPSTSPARPPVIISSAPSPPPKKDLLEQLNVVDAVQDDQEQEDGGGMELVLGDIPSAAEETTTTTSTSTDTPSSIRNQTSLISFVVDQETTYDYGTTTKSSESESNTKDTEQQQGIEEEDVATMVKLVQEKLKAVESKERLISQIKSFDSADKPPRVYEDDDSDDSSGGIVLDEPRVPIEPTTVTVTATEAAAAVTPEKSSLPQPDGLVTPVKSSPMSVSSQASQTPFDQKAVQRPTFVGGEDPTIREQRGGNADTTKDNAKDTRKRMSPEAVTKKLLQAFSCAGDMLPEKLQKHIPNINACATDYTCMPTTMSKQMVPKRKPLYNDQFAVDFLDVRYRDVCVVCVCAVTRMFHLTYWFVFVFLSQELLNVGFALVSHQPPTEEQPDWIGRSVTMLLRPGICNAKTTAPPQLEWSTMGGGMAPRVETKSVALLKIHSVTNSPTDDENNQEGRDDNDEAQERNCFFTLTTNQGEVHVFETIATEESDRSVSGIKNLVARLSTQLISGDTNAFADFYNNNSGEPNEIKFTPDEAMVRLSHSFFD
jgi:hypothetical protein